MPRSSPRPPGHDKKLLEKRIKEFQFLTRSSHALNSTLDLDRLLNRILQIVKDALAVETASVLFLDAEKKNMVFALAHGKRGREILGTKIPLGEGVVGWVAKNERPLIINDLSKDKRFSVSIEKKLGLKTRSIMSIPLKRKNKLIGVLEAVNHKAGVLFSGEDLEFFLALGDHIATAIDNARLYREAERSRLENSVLYRISLALGKALALDEVLDQLLTSLKQLIEYDAAAIFVLDRKNQELVSHLQQGYRPGREAHLRLKLDEGLVGWAAREKKGIIVSDTSKDPRYVSARRRTRSEMVTPMLSRGKVIGLFNLESNRTCAYDAGDLRLLESFAAIAGVSLERARLFEEQQVKQEIERELRVARTIQEFFTPSKSRKLGKYTLTGRNYPSLELSGDYLDVFPLQKPYAAFAVADVAGKGVPASIIMSSFRATLHTGAPYFTSAREFAVRANQILMETVRPNDFVTAFIGVLNSDTGEVTYCNAGHEPAILMAPDGGHRLLKAGGTVLGVLENNELREGSFRLGDDVLLAYTDGITDALDPDEEPFGRKRLITFLRKHRHLSPGRICTALRKQLKDHMRGTPQIDDLTFLVLKK
ncbi:MAG: GAF domain-containing protein [Candidatus Krumholzibacteria bacterium]